MWKYWKRVLVDVEHQHAHRLARCGLRAQRHDVDLGEDVEGVDRRGHQHVEQDRPQQRQGDVAEPLPGRWRRRGSRPRGTGPGCCGCRPGTGSGCSPRTFQTPMMTSAQSAIAGIGQPGHGGDADKRQAVVEDAVIVVVDPLPGDRHRHHRRDHRQEVDGLVERRQPAARRPGTRQAASASSGADDARSPASRWWCCFSARRKLSSLSSWM